MEKRVIVFSLDGVDEHIGVVVDDTDTCLVVSNVATLAKQQTEQGISVNMIPFAFNSFKLKKVTVMKKNICWFSEELDDTYKKQYLASISGLVIPTVDDMEEVKKSNVIQMQNYRK